MFNDQCSMFEVCLQDVFFSTSSLNNPGINQETVQSWFQSWFGKLSEQIPEAIAYELCLRLTGDHEMQTLNCKYRNKNVPTDVLAFATSEVNMPQLDKSEPLYLGDIIISVDTAWKQAQEQRHSLQVELAWLTSHGFLHLLGWDHPDQDSLEEMLSVQETLLKLVGLVPQNQNFLPKYTKV
ncbi:MAG: rRNA maturation RNase YbeY [Spirulinaceae cyanobacterium]